MKNDWVQIAARAHSNLNAFAIIRDMLESGAIYSNSRTAQTSVMRIVRICDDEIQRQLRLYDKAVGKAKGERP